jgi:hypothetical protein
MFKFLIQRVLYLHNHFRSNTKYKMELEHIKSLSLKQIIIFTYEHNNK